MMMEIQIVINVDDKNAAFQSSVDKALDAAKKAAVNEFKKWGVKARLVKGGG